MSYGAEYATKKTGENILDNALTVAGDGVDDIAHVLADVEANGGKINNGNGQSGLTVAHNHGLDTSVPEIDISTAAGAMVVDDLMQKISTEVQTASQMLSAANNLTKTASRILSQG